MLKLLVPMINVPSQQFLWIFVGRFLATASHLQGQDNSMSSSLPVSIRLGHSPKRWPNKDTMLQYVANIIVPYIKCAREDFEEDTPALVIHDNFKGQITEAVYCKSSKNSAL